MHLGVPPYALEHLRDRRRPDVEEELQRHLLISHGSWWVTIGRSPLL